MRKEMRAEDVVELLRKRCAEAGGLRPWAREHGIAVQYVWQIISGLKPPSDTVAKALGLRPDGMRWVRE
jgi:hypothetical protein